MSEEAELKTSNGWKVAFWVLFVMVAGLIVISLISANNQEQADKANTQNAAALQTCIQQAQADNNPNEDLFEASSIAQAEQVAINACKAQY